MGRLGTEVTWGQTAAPRWEAERGGWFVLNRVEPGLDRRAHGPLSGSAPHLFLPGSRLDFTVRRPQWRGADFTTVTSPCLPCPLGGVAVSKAIHLAVNCGPVLSPFPANERRQKGL